MTKFMTGGWARGAALGLAAALLLAAGAPAAAGGGEEEEESICRTAFMQCLSWASVQGIFDYKAFIVLIPYCLNGYYFCERFIEDFIRGELG